MKGRAISYLPQELAWIEARKELPRAEAHALFCAYWQRDDVSLNNFKALCKRKGWMTGRTGCFVKGAEPQNKGRAMPADVRAKCMATAFKPGGVPANRQPLWTERDDGYGYVEIKVPQRNPYTGHKTRFVHKHRYLWEQANGPLPSGHALKCLDGDKTNCDPSNWEAIPRGVLARLNGGRHKRRLAYDAAPPELKPAVMAAAKLAHAAREARKGGNP